MARHASKHPTDGELEILRILWDKNGCSLSQLCEELRASRDVATTTVATMLRVMLTKKLVKRRTSERGFLWSANVSRTKTAGAMLTKLLEAVYEGSASRLVTHLIESEALTPQEFAELEALVDARRSQSRSTPEKKQP